MAIHPQPKYEPLAGWAFHLLTRLDINSPGILAHVCRMRTDRRLATLTVLAKEARDLLGAGEHGVEHAPAVSGALLAMEPVTKDIRRLATRDLLERYLGSCPDAFLGALGKLSYAPETDAPEVLLGLHALFEKRGESKLAKVLRQLPALTTEQIEAIGRLDTVYQTPRFAARVRKIELAENLNAFLRIVRERAPGVMPSFAESVRNIDPKTTIGEWCSRWAVRLPLPPSGICPPSGFFELTDGPKLRECGLRMRNCLGSLDAYLEVLQGSRAYFVSEKFDVVVEVAIVGPMRFPVFWKAWGVDNHSPSMLKRRDVESAFLDAGVPTISWYPADEAVGLIQRLSVEFEGFPDLEDSFTVLSA